MGNWISNTGVIDVIVAMAMDLGVVVESEEGDLPGSIAQGKVPTLG